LITNCWIALTLFLTVNQFPQTFLADPQNLPMQNS
jgi:hypothetical protein